MTVQTRIRTILLMEKMQNNQEYAEKLGLYGKTEIINPERKEGDDAGVTDASVPVITVSDINH